VKGDNLDSGAVLEKLLTLGDSVLVAGDGSLLRVHVHTHDPEAVLSYGASLGSVTTVKVDNVQAEVEENARLSLAGFGRDVAPPDSLTQTDTGRSSCP